MTTRPAYGSNLFFLFTALFSICLGCAAWLDSYFIAAIPFVILLAVSAWGHFEFVFYALLLTLPFSTEMQFSPELGTDFPDEPLMVLTAALFILHWVCTPKAMPSKFPSHPLMILLACGFLWAVAATFSSTHPLASVKFLLAKSWYIGAFVLGGLMVFRDKNRLFLSMRLLAGAMVLAVMIVLARHARYGFSFAGINEALKPFFRNHVNYSAMLVCILPILFAFYHHSKKKNWLRRLLAIIVALSMLALFFSYSRGAWLALLAGLLAYWLIKKKLILHFYLGLILMVLMAFFWLRSQDRYLEYAHDYRSTVFHEDFREHFRATYEFKDVSTAERFYRWIAGARMIGEKPLSGFGPSTFYNNYRPYAVPAFKTWVSNNPEHSTVHNYFLLLIVEQGFPGLLIFLLLAGAMLYYAQTVYHRAGAGWIKSVALGSGVVLIMILTVNFLSDLVETDKVGSLFFMVLAALMVADMKSKERSDTAPDV